MTDEILARGKWGLLVQRDDGPRTISVVPPEDLCPACDGEMVERWGERHCHACDAAERRAFFQAFPRLTKGMDPDQVAERDDRLAFVVILLAIMIAAAVLA